MKIKAVKLKTLVLIALTTWSMSSFAQRETIMYVMKNGVVIFQLPVSAAVNNVTFDSASSDNALIVKKTDGSPIDKILLNNIQQLSFSGDSLSIETLTGSEIVAFDGIAKLFFGDMNTSGIKNPPAQVGFDVIVSVTPAGDVTVESPVAIKSLTLFSVDGKMISKQHCNGVETWHAASLQGRPAGVYILRVETEQNTVVKKVVKQ
ncbi:MAG: T9SS type A sorting domain-containing protein [Paludibacter sp.]|nr:T9SS type A sorting domain-containing protein [Paludibacter sp.]